MDRDDKEFGKKREKLQQQQKVRSVTRQKGKKNVVTVTRTLLHYFEALSVLALLLLGELDQRRSRALDARAGSKRQRRWLRGVLRRRRRQCGSRPFPVIHTLEKVRQGVGGDDLRASSARRERGSTTDGSVDDAATGRRRARSQRA